MPPARLVLAAALLISGCDALPRDIEHSSDRMAQSGTIRVGVVEAGAARGGKLLAELAATTGAAPQLVRGSAEPLLVALEGGRLDLVIAPFAADTPWVTRVSLAPPIAAHGADEDRIEWRAAMRNGESKWVMTVERASRKVAAPEATE